MSPLACTNALAFKHDQLATAERAPAGGWRALCPCGASWRLTDPQVLALGLDTAREPGAIEPADSEGRP